MTPPIQVGLAQHKKKKGRLGAWSLTVVSKRKKQDEHVDHYPGEGLKSKDSTWETLYVPHDKEHVTSFMKH